MPISASQHRLSVGFYNNKFNNKIIKNNTRNDCINMFSENENKIQSFGYNINRIINSFDAMSRSPYQNISKNGVIAHLLMLLCHIRLPGNPLSIATDNTSLSYGNVNSANGDHSIRPESYFSTIFNPLAKALHDAGQFISRHDPLRFPLAEATEISVDTVSHYEIKDKYINIALFHELSGKNISDISYGMAVEPLIIFYPRKESSLIDLQSAPAEISMKESLDAYKNKYLNENCQIITKDNDGKLISNSLLVSSVDLDNIIKNTAEAVYKKTMGGNEMPSWLVDFTEKTGVGYDILFGVATLGIYTGTKALLIKSLRTSGYAIDNNKHCALNEASREQLARLMMDIEIGISDRESIAKNSNRPQKKQGIDNPIYPESSKKSPPDNLETFPRKGTNSKGDIEDETINTARMLGNTKGFEPDGVFVHQNTANNVNTVRYMTVNHHGSVYRIREKKPGEYWSYHPDAMKPEILEKRVYLDPVSEKIYFSSEMPDGHGLDYDFIDGKKFIHIDGNNHEIHWDWNKNSPEIVVRKIDGSSVNIPVYMEPLSKNWHFSVHNDKVFFNQAEIDLIKQLKVEKGDFSYIAVTNERPSLYGNGHIYKKEKIEYHNYKKVGNSLIESRYNTRENLGYFVEMNGEIVPVRKIINDEHGVIYTVYDLNNPLKKGYPIQWEGDRWLFDKKTSIYVSDDLKKIINPRLFSDQTSAGRLSAPDSNGLRHTASGDMYLIIRGKYIKLTKSPSQLGNMERYSIRQDDGTLLYVRFKDDGLFHLESFDERLDFINKSQTINKEHIYEEIHARSELPENNRLEYQVINGKNFIEINGDNHEILWNWHKNRPEIIINKLDGHLINIPVYMEPLSKTWHVSMHKNKVFFSQNELDFINKVKVKVKVKCEGSDYIPVINENNRLYGNGHVYIEKRLDDPTHEHLGYYVEMHGELVPVMKTTNNKREIIYTVHDLNNSQDKGYPISWEGDRWLFDKKTSIYVSEDLTQAIDLTKFSDTISSGMLLAPDKNGLRRTMNGDSYLLIQGKYIRLKKADSEQGVIERYSMKKDDGTLLYIRLKDDGFFHVESFDEWLEFMHRLSAVNAHRFHNRADSEHIYQEISFNNKIPKISGLDYEVIDGKNIINIKGDKHEVFWSWRGNHPEIILKKRDGHPTKISVYMEAISKKWHLSKYKNRYFLNTKNKARLDEIKIEKEGFSYEKINNDNYRLYGDGHLYVRKGNEENLIYCVEIDGDLAPVRKIKNDKEEVIYEIYDLKYPQQKGSAIQWDGNRWLFYKKSSISISSGLNNLVKPKKYTEEISSGLLSAPDSKELRYAENGDAYIKINGKYINIKKEASEIGVIERYSIKNDNEVLLYIRYKDDGFFHAESFNERQEFIHRLNLQGREETQKITFLTFSREDTYGGIIRDSDMMEITTKGSRHAESVVLTDKMFGDFYSKIDNELLYKYENAIKHLTDEQYSAVMYWRKTMIPSESTGFYGGASVEHALNHLLQNNIKLDENQEFIYKNIISALNSDKYPVKEGSYFRMISHRMDGDFSSIDNLNVGDIVTNSNRFMSVSDNSLFINEKTRDILNNHRDQVMITYMVDNASKAKPIYHALSSEIKYQEEYLYLPQSYFRVTGVSYSHSSARPTTIGVSLEEIDKPKHIIAKDIFMGME